MGACAKDSRIGFRADNINDVIAVQLRPEISEYSRWTTNLRIVGHIELVDREHFIMA